MVLGRWGVPVVVLLTGCVPQLESTFEPEPDGTPWLCPENRWDCEEPPAEVVESTDYGFFEGQTLPEGRLFDQHGDEVEIWQFSGKIVLLDLSPLWCSACRELACYAEDTWQGFRDRGVVYVTVMPQNNHGAPPVVDDLNYWADRASISAPVLGDTPQGWSRTASPQNLFPIVLVTDRDLVVQERLALGSDTLGNDTLVRHAIERQLGVPESTHTPESGCDE